MTPPKVLEAEERMNRWLADGNEAEERGDMVKAEKCFSKSQFWLDRYNRLTGNAEKERSDGHWPQP